MVITSRQNPKLKDIRHLRRCKDDRALLEGLHLVGEALAAGLALEPVLATPELLATADGAALAARLPRPPLAVAASALASVTDADSPRGLVAVARLPRGGVEALTPRPRGLWVFADGLQDPGNLGALARVAEAAGAAGLCLAAGSVHPNHPRALRASAGSLLRLPVAVDATPQALSRRLAAGGEAPRWLVLATRGGEDLFRSDLTGPLVIAVGAEGPGLSAGIAARADLTVTIPLAPPVESLNATVAAAVVLFEIRRRRLHCVEETLAADAHPDRGATP